MKKTIVFLLALVMVISFAACTQPSAPSDEPQVVDQTTAPEPEEKEEPAFADVTITLMASVDWIQEAEYDLAEKFTEKTGIKVDYQIVPSDQYPNLLTTKLNSGECTDIFCSQGGRFDVVNTLNVEKNAVDLSNEPWASTLDQTVAIEVSADGKLYGQPNADLYGCWAMAYNKKIFSELELSVPKTWAEFTAVCDAIKASGVTPIYQPVSDGWHHVLWFAEIGPVYEKAEPGLVDKLNDNQMKLADSAVMKTAIDQIKEMVDNGYWGKNYMADEYADQPAKIASGKYAMTIANSGLPEQVAEVGEGLTADDVGFFLIPLADNQIVNLNPSGPTKFVYSGSKNIEAAKLYLEFLAETENLQYLLDNVPKFMDLPYSGLQSKYTGTLKEFYDSIANNEKGTVLQTAVKYVNPQWMEIGKEIVSVILDKSDATKMLEFMDRNREDQALAVKDPAW